MEDWSGLTHYSVRDTEDRIIPCKNADFHKSGGCSDYEI
jgi:hypothetical protein